MFPSKRNAGKFIPRKKKVTRVKVGSVLVDDHGMVRDVVFNPEAFGVRRNKLVCDWCLYPTTAKHDNVFEFSLLKNNKLFLVEVRGRFEVDGNPEESLDVLVKAFVYRFAYVDTSPWLLCKLCIKQFFPG